MRVILFQDRFIGLIKQGIKTTTIRKRARCKFGDTLSLRRWTGRPYRSKQDVIAQAVCRSVKGIVITESHVEVDGILVDGTKIAVKDGFTCQPELESWFREVHGIPFYGSIIEWELLTTPCEGSQEIAA